jgi:hypothetical protein
MTTIRTMKARAGMNPAIGVQVHALILAADTARCNTAHQRANLAALALRARHLAAEMQASGEPGHLSVRAYGRTLAALARQAR